jgi:hypothetical protein
MFPPHLRGDRLVWQDNRREMFHCSYNFTACLTSRNRASECPIPRLVVEDAKCMLCWQFLRVQ